MRQLTITLITPGGMDVPNTTLPDDMKTEEIISELKVELGLPDFADNGHPVKYFVVIPERNLTMMPGQTLRDVALENGDKIQLMSSEPVQPAEIEIPGGGDPHSPMIDVSLSVLDPNRAVKRSLPADLAVDSLIHSIMAKENPKASATGHYRLQSKALGRFLLPSETLRSAGVPSRDHLSIHEHVTAGGAQ